MLVLTRRIGEKIHIGDDITVTVIGTCRGTVRLAFDAPRSVEVHREEIYRRMQAEKAGKAVA